MFHFRPNLCGKKMPYPVIYFLIFPAYFGMIKPLKGIAPVFLLNSRPRKYFLY